MANKLPITFGKPAQLWLLIAIGTIGCDARTRQLVDSLEDKHIDRTADRRYWGGYEPGQLYETARDLLYDGRDLDVHFYWPIGAAQTSRVDFDEYLNRPDAYPGITLVPEGTRFRVTRVQEVHSFEYSSLDMTAQFTSGPSSGASFDLAGVSRFEQSDGLGWRLAYPSDLIRTEEESDTNR